MGLWRKLTPRAGRARQGAPARISPPGLVLAAALAIACVLASHPDRVLHWPNDLTWNHLTLSENLSPAHGFASFYWRKQTPAGERYMAYHRFPVLGHLAIKLVTLPFPVDAAARIRAARTLMLGFFAAAAALAWLAVRRLIDDDWTALAAVLIAFSAFHALCYADMVATEGVVDLFAVMLVFHGAAVFAGEDRFGQLLAKVCAALLLGWHVLALVAPLAVLGLGAGLWRADWRSARRYFALGAVAVLFAAAVLAVNLSRERTVDVATPLAELPSVTSALDKVGIAPRRPLDWTQFTGAQLHRLGLASVPWAAGRLAIGDAEAIWSEAPDSIGFALAGGVVLATALCLGARSSGVDRSLGGRRAAGHTGRLEGRLALVALALTGPCWTVAVRHTSYPPWHAFEGMFHVGVPICFFALALPAVATARASRQAIGLVAVVVFALSAAASAHTLNDPARAERARAVASDLDAVLAAADDDTVLTPADMWLDLRYLLRGVPQVRFVDLDDWRLAALAVDVRLAPGGVATPTLTPRNQLRFLYRRGDYEAALGRSAALAAERAPSATAAGFDIHHLANDGFGDDLLYARRNCPPDFHRRANRIFLHVYPRIAAPSPRSAGAFVNLDISRRWFWRHGQRCFALRRLPTWPIASIHTGQFKRHRALASETGTPRYEHVWAVWLRPDDAAARPGTATPDADD